MQNQQQVNSRSFLEIIMKFYFVVLYKHDSTDSGLLLWTFYIGDGLHEDRE